MPPEGSPPPDRLATQPLELTGFTYTPVGRRRSTLTDITLSIPAGQRVLLAGASGSGKSTLLRALAGLLEDEDQVADAPPPGSVALMVQNPAHAIVGANAGLDIAFAPENEQVPREQIPALVARARERAQFTPPLDADTFRLSGGEQQRLALAGVLAVTSGALLMDEPLTMLDRTTGAQVRSAVMHAVDATGRTCVVADHHLENWADWADRLIVLGGGGVILADGEPDQLLTDQRGLLSHLGLWLPGNGTRSGSATDNRTESVPAQQSAPVFSPADASRPEPLLLISGIRCLEGRELFAAPVSVSARPGELTVITGASGVGKSTLLRHILTTELPKGGAAFLPQNPEVSFAAQTVLGEVLATPGVTEAAASEALEGVGLDHLHGANPFTLSGGEQRRLAFAAAFAAHRPLLVLDEPTVGLDRTAFEDAAALIRSALDRGAAVIAATHDEHLMARADERVHLTGLGSVASTAAAERAGVVVPTAAVAGAGAEEPIPRVQPKPVILADAFNPLTILLIALCAAVGSFAIDSLLIGAVCFALTLLVIPLAFRSVPRLLLRIVPVSVGALSLVWSTFLLSGNPWSDPDTWALAGKEGFRLFFLVAPGAILTEGIDATRLGQAGAQILKLPARAMAAMIAGLVRVGHMRAQWNAIILTRSLRGIHRRNPFKLYAGATFSLLVWALRGADTQALAMDARGFGSAQHRSWVHRSDFRFLDVIGLLLGLALGATPVVLSLVL